MNPVALVTGASRGIGRGIALELAKLGYDLVLNFVRQGAAAETVARECVDAGAGVKRPMRAELCQADIAEAVGRKRLMDHVRNVFGRLDLLVNNAGVAPVLRTDLLESSEESFDRVMSINAKGPYFLTQAAAKLMVEQQRSKAAAAPGGPGPKIVTISSVSAYAASPNRGEYCVAKAALSMVTKLFAARLAEDGIAVFEIRPGIIATDMTEPVKERYDRLIAEGLTPIRRWGTPDDVGRAVAAIALDLFPFSTGEVINVDGGFHLHRL